MPALQNFVDKVSHVTTAWLNQVDVLLTTVFGQATNNVQARTALFSDSPLELSNGGTGKRSFLPSSLLGTDVGGNITTVPTPPAPIIYVQTPQELAAGVTPVNTSILPGDFRRYGADPTGVLNSSTAIATAISCNDVIFDGYQGGGAYLINGPVILKSVLRISGTSKTNTGLLTSGTNFIIGPNADPRGALHATGLASDFEIERITFSFQNNALGQTAIYFDIDCRSSRIHDCNFNGGVPTAATNSGGIGFGGGGTFTGDVTIEKNYFTNLQVGVGISGACTTVRILSNEMYTNAAIPGSVGINNQSTTGGVVIAFNTFQAWNKAIVAPLGVTRQLYNYFEGNLTLDFDWGTSSFNVEIGSTSTGAPLANFLYNNSSSNVVLGLYGTNLDSSVMKAWRGFAEQNRTVANGHQQTRAFAAGNYTGNGSIAWTVTSSEVLEDILVVNGNEATYYFFVQSSTVAGIGSALNIALPPGVTALARSRSPAWTNDNGAAGTGVAEVLAGAATVNIYKDPTTSSNWSTSTTTTSVAGSIKFPISFSVN